MKLKKLKYAVYDKVSKKTTLHQFKTSVADKVGVSFKTIQRNIPYENDFYIVSELDMS